MDKIGIIVNPNKDIGLCHLKSVVSLLEKNGYQCAVSCGDYENTSSETFCDAETCFKDARLVLTLGGDGTILRVATLANRYNVPLLGINLGHVGFLAEMEPFEIDLLPSLLKDGFECTDRMMLDVSILRGGEVLSRAIALNDAVIRSQSGKPVHIMISDAQNDLIDYFCDGFIISGLYSACTVPILCLYLFTRQRALPVAPPRALWVSALLAGWLWCRPSAPSDL
jgi:NAD+ kinase